MRSATFQKKLITRGILLTSNEINYNISIPAFHAYKVTQRGQSFHSLNHSSCISNMEKTRRVNQIILEPQNH